MGKITGFFALVIVLGVWLFLSAADVVSAGLARALFPQIASSSQPQSGLPGFLPGSQPGLELLAASPASIDIQANLDGIQAEDRYADGEAYTYLSGEGYGIGGQIGLPGLPVLSRDVEIPPGARPSLELVDAQYQDYSLSDLGFHTVYPLQPPVVKLPGAADNQPFEMDRNFYQQAGWYPAFPLALGETYVVRGHHIQPVQVWPLAYDPPSATLRVYTQITFRLNLSSADMGAAELQAQRYASPDFDRALSAYVLNYTEVQSEQTQSTPEGYLIITADDYFSAISPFVELQIARGYAVTVTKLSQIPGGSTKEAIKAYIQEAYNTWSIPPSYLLLVGDTNTIPAWSSTTSLGKFTDLYYATLDGGDDWHPDLRRGRFPVRSVEQVNNIVNKYLSYYNLTGQEPWLRKIAFIATCDNTFYAVAEGSHNYVISAYTNPLGYTGIFPTNPQPGGDKIYCISNSGTTADIRSAVNEGRWALVYSGHGYETAWTDGGVSFNQSDIRNLTGLGFYPFVASYACQTGSFGSTLTNESFSETWVLQPEKGALVALAASHNTYWNEDDILERHMWDRQFQEGDLPTVGMVTDYGLAQVDSHSSLLDRYYWEAYNLMGDPSVRMLNKPVFKMNLNPTSVDICNAGTEGSTVAISSLYNYNQTVYLEHNFLPVGVSAAFSTVSAVPSFTSTLALAVSPETSVGDYTVVITATDAVEITRQAQLALRVVDEPPTAAALLTPPDGAADQLFLPAFTWQPTPLTRYDLQLSRSAAFNSLVVGEASLDVNTFSITTALEGGQCYWWRTKGTNACGETTWSEAFHFLTAAFSDTMESGRVNWTTWAAVGEDKWALSNAQAYSPSYAWFVPDVSTVTDSSLRTKEPVLLGAGSKLSFWHRYQYEGANYDGSVLEISTNGVTWIDLGPYISANGYTGTINSSWGNPLKGQPAWTGDLTTWTRVEVDLSNFAGQEVYIRWRLGCDSSGSDMGWYIDDVHVSNPLPPRPAPQMDEVQPAFGFTFLASSILVYGENFTGYPSLKLGDTWLPTTLISPSLVQAVLPGGLQPGVYDLELYNGDCQYAILSGAYEVLEDGYALFLPLIERAP